MKARYDIAVIGGGVIGLALARELAAHSLEIAVIDDSARTPPASLAAAGMLAPSFEEDLGGAALYDFSAASLDLWPAFAAALVDETGVDVDFRDFGTLGVSFDADREKKLEAQCEALQKRGATVSMLTGDEARDLEPALSSGVIAALHALRDAQVDAVKVIMALRASVCGRGADLIEGRVTEATLALDGWRARLDDGASLRADRIVVAIGAAPGWPIAGVARPQIYPVKGEALSISSTEAPLLTRVVRGPDAYLCPKAGGRLVIGATEAPGAADLDVDGAAIDGLRAGANVIAPGLKGWAESARWAGLRPATPDGAPILGRAPGAYDRAWFALGHHRNGVLLAPASAVAMAAELLGKPREIDLSAFSAGRFD